MDKDAISSIVSEIKDYLSREGFIKFISRIADNKFVREKIAGCIMDIWDKMCKKYDITNISHKMCETGECITIMLEMSEDKRREFIDRLQSFLESTRSSILIQTFLRDCKIEELSCDVTDYGVEVKLIGKNLQNCVDKVKEVFGVVSSEEKEEEVGVV